MDKEDSDDQLSPEEGEGERRGEEDPFVAARDGKEEVQGQSRVKENISPLRVI